MTMNLNRLKGVNVLDSEDSPFSISPLPPVLRHGLAAVATFGFLSFFTSVTLFFFLTYKLVSWQIKPKCRQMREDPEPESPAVSDINGFLVPDDHLCPQKAMERAPTKERFRDRIRREPPNQFLVLIFNLLFADIQQAMAFLLNVAWLMQDAVQVGSTTCWSQGWFVSTGDLASSVFITVIAGHTYLGVVRGYRLPTWAFYTAIALCWSFVYGTAILGVVITDNGSGHGGLYVRAGAWCWINSAFQDLRLYLHYLWIFISLALTTIIYTVIFLHLQSIARKAGKVPSSLSRSSSRAQHYPNPDPNPNELQPPGSPRSFQSTDSSLSTLKRLPPIPSYARQQTFLLYPLIYVLCTVPLAAGRIASMAGNNVSLAYFCFAGAMIACNGWLDVALYSTTRRSIVFSGEAPPSQDTGLETFAFMRTPPNRKFGNVVFVSGGQDPEGKSKRWNKWNEKLMRGGGKLNHVKKSEASSSSDSLRGFGMGDGAVMGMAIQCETVTSVVVEVEEKSEHGPRLGSRKGSIASEVSMHTAKSRTLTG